MDRVSGMSVFGCDIYEKYPEIVEIGQYRNSFSSRNKFLDFFRMLVTIYNVDKCLEEMLEVCEKAKDQLSQKRLDRLQTSSDILSLVLRSIADLEVVVYNHMVASNRSTIFQMIAFSILTNKSDKLTMQHQSDIALILGSMSDVESANVPEMISDIAARIAFEQKHAEFVEVDSTTAVQWLEENCAPASKLLKDFMKRHGHRSINELDFIAKPWSMEPEKVIEMIKSNLINAGGSTKKSQMTTDEIVASLKTPLGSVQKYLIRKTMPKSQDGVRHRELAKSRLVMVTNEIRRAVIHLGKTMVHEGLLPDKELVFFLSLGEIKDVVASREGKLVAKAIRRQKLFPKLNEMKFTEITFGIPRPLSFESNNNNEPAVKGDVLIRGTPVCGGVITAKACVCKSFAEVNQLQKGDILVTYGELEKLSMT